MHLEFYSRVSDAFNGNNKSVKDTNAYWKFVCSMQEYAFHKESRTDLVPMISIETLGIESTEIDTNNGEDGIYRSLPEISDQIY